MRIFGRIYGEVLVEIFSTDGDIKEMFHPDVIWVDITEVDPMPSEGWTYTLGTFAPPVPYSPTPSERLQANKLDRDSLLGVATLAIAPLQDAIDLKKATTVETALLTEWKDYRIAVNRIDLTVAEPSWPVAPA